MSINADLPIDYHASQTEIAKSMVIAMLIHNFDFFSKTISQIHFKLSGDMPWVGLYQVYLNGHGPVIFGFVMNFFGSFSGEILKYLYPCKYTANCFEIAYGYFWV